MKFSMWHSHKESYGNPSQLENIKMEAIRSYLVRDSTELDFSILNVMVPTRRLYDEK